MIDEYRTLYANHRLDISGSNAAAERTEAQLLFGLSCSQCRGDIHALHPPTPGCRGPRLQPCGHGNVWRLWAGGCTDDDGPYSAVVINKLIVAPCLPSDLGFFLQYGVVTGYDQDTCSTYGSETGNLSGIVFTPPAASSNGSYSFVQVLPSGNTTTYIAGASVGAFTTTPGLDGQYPYPLQPGYDNTNDSPDAALGANYSQVSRTFAANMYLLWTSSTSGSIAVPIGFQKWCFQTNTTNGGYPASQIWSTPVSQYVGTDGEFVVAATQATSQTTPFGYPTWGGLATTTWSTPAPTNPPSNCP